MGLGGGWSSLPGEGDGQEVMKGEVLCTVNHSCPVLLSRGSPAEAQRLAHV